MDFIEEVTDLGAPEYAVTGVASIERISPGQVRVTKYSRRKDGNIITHHEVWDLFAWLHDRSLNEQVSDLISRMTPSVNQLADRGARNIDQHHRSAPIRSQRRDRSAAFDNSEYRT